VAAKAHLGKRPGETTLRDFTLEEGVLYIKLNKPRAGRYGAQVSTARLTRGVSFGVITPNLDDAPVTFIAGSYLCEKKRSGWLVRAPGIGQCHQQASTA
jgi:hypothetical protein